MNKLLTAVAAFAVLAFVNPVDVDAAMKNLRECNRNAKEGTFTKNSCKDSFHNSAVKDYGLNAPSQRGTKDNDPDTDNPSTGGGSVDNSGGNTDTGGNTNPGGNTDDGNNGHGNDDDHDDDSNPGKGKDKDKNKDKHPNNGHGNDPDGNDNSNPGKSNDPTDNTDADGSPGRSGESHGKKK